MPKEEMILAIPRTLFDQLGSFQGLNLDVGRYLPAFLSRQNNRFLPRSSAETDPSWKQIIPYALITLEDRVLHYTRSKKGGESRLHAKGSLGIGGHMNDHDEGLFALDADAYRAGVQRELNEELHLPEVLSNDIVALLNDDSNDVGKVHLGVVHRVRVASADVRAREAAIANPHFLSLAELAPLRDNLETWSQICLDQLPMLLAHPHGGSPAR